MGIHHPISLQSSTQTKNKTHHVLSQHLSTLFEQNGNSSSNQPTIIINHQHTRKNKTHHILSQHLSTLFIDVYCAFDMLIIHSSDEFVGAIVSALLFPAGDIEICGAVSSCVGWLISLARYFMMYHRPNSFRS